MNWKEIYKNNKDAFIKARNWWGINNIALISLPTPIINIPKTTRDLYEFFDIYGIHIESDWLYEEMIDDYDFETKIYTKENYPDYIFCSAMYKSRIKSEHEAIEKAFEMLQEMINEGKIKKEL